MYRTIINPNDNYSLLSEPSEGINTTTTNISYYNKWIDDTHFISAKLNNYYLTLTKFTIDENENCSNSIINQIIYFYNNRTWSEEGIFEIENLNSIWLCGYGGGSSVSSYYGILYHITIDNNFTNANYTQIILNTATQYAQTGKTFSAGIPYYDNERGIIVFSTGGGSGSNYGLYQEMLYIYGLENYVREITSDRSPFLGLTKTSASAGEQITLYTPKK